MWRPYLNPRQIIRSEVTDLSSGRGWGGGDSEPTDSYSLQKSQVDKEINQAGTGLDRWLTFGR